MQGKQGNQNHVQKAVNQKRGSNHIFLSACVTTQKNQLFSPMSFEKLNEIALSISPTQLKSFNFESLFFQK